MRNEIASHVHGQTMLPEVSESTPEGLFGTLMQRSVYRRDDGTWFASRKPAKVPRVHQGETMVPTTVDRVSNQTCDAVNARIRRQTEENITRLKYAGPTLIARRLEELNREWDIERAIEANAATASLIGVTLGVTVNRRWLALPALVGAFLLQHAVQGWCPPLPVLRRLGFRTASEIDHERYALKALRGDFTDIYPDKKDRGNKFAEKALQAVES